ncbi:MAG: exodeoxyribonuclease III [Solirubrobacteraceae bacterium]
MRVVTWNVNSLKMRLPRVLEFLEQHEPDIVFLQETKSTADAFPFQNLEATGYTAVEHSAGQWAGVALLARDPLQITEPSTGLPGDPVAEEARWIEATIAGIRCASTYVPNGRTLDSPEYPRKLAFLDAIEARVTKRDEAPMIIAGDFNIAPADIDVYDPAAFVGGTHVSAAERDRLQKIESTGLIDCYRHVHPDTQQFTWWDYRAGHFHKGLGLRIDLILASNGLGAGLTRCGIERDYRKGTKPSDHAPLLAEFELSS